jgi:hypothetical protein
VAPRSKKTRLAAARKAAETRARKKREREAEARRLVALARKRSLAAKRAATTRRARREEEAHAREAAARKRAQAAKKGWKTRLERARKPAKLPKKTPKKVRDLEPAPRKGQILSAITSLADLLALARASRRFELEQLQNLRFVDGEIYADTPAGRVFRFYTVETEAGVSGYWTTAKVFSEAFEAEPEDETGAPPDDDNDSYEALNEPHVHFAASWDFERRCPYRSPRDGRRCILVEGHQKKKHVLSKKDEWNSDAFDFQGGA